jgi:hypothetical protein
MVAFSTSWNEFRARMENRESLTKGLVAGGPVEAKGDVLDLGSGDFFTGLFDDEEVLDLGAPEDEGKEG